MDVSINTCNWQCQALHLLQPSLGRIIRNTRSERLRPPGTGCSHVRETLACYLLWAISEILKEHFVFFWLVVFFRIEHFALPRLQQWPVFSSILISWFYILGLLQLLKPCACLCQVSLRQLKITKEILSQDSRRASVQFSMHLILRPLNHSFHSSRSSSSPAVNGAKIHQRNTRRSWRKADWGYIVRVSGITLRNQGWSQQSDLYFSVYHTYLFHIHHPKPASILTPSSSNNIFRC